MGFFKKTTPQPQQHAHGEWTAEPDPGPGPLPFLISWNITKRCNLRCEHCYLDAAELEGLDETTTAEAKGFIDEIAGLNRDSMLILTGGEPLLRPDLPELAGYASGLGLTVVVGTNGTLLDDAVVATLIEKGVKGVGVSLDSVDSGYHDRFRGTPGAWATTLAGMEALKRLGLDFQVQLTVTRENRHEVPELIRLAHAQGARAVNIFFLVCTGRGQSMTDLRPDEYEKVLEYLAEAEDEFEGKIMVRARCAPHFLRVVSARNPDAPVLKGQTSGCIAGTGYLRISPEGFVTACPYIPPNDATHNIKRLPLRDIWFNDPAFLTLREPKYNGRCADCEFNDICGGCRARSLASSGDIMGEDPWCEYEPKGKAEGRPVPADFTPAWTPEAKERLGKVPVFLRGMVKKGVERYAKAKGMREITPEVMSELRKRTGR